MRGMSGFQWSELNPILYQSLSLHQLPHWPPDHPAALGKTLPLYFFFLLFFSSHYFVFFSVLHLLHRGIFKELIEEKHQLFTLIALSFVRKFKIEVKTKSECHVWCKLEGAMGLSCFIVLWIFHFFFNDSQITVSDFWMKGCGEFCIILTRRGRKASHYVDH